MEDPCEDGLFMLLSNLNPAGSTFITITGAGEDPAWYAPVTLPGYGTFEVERNGTCHGEHDQPSRPGPATSPAASFCPAAGDYPGRPARRSTPDI